MSEGRQILGASVARWTASLTTTAWKCVGAGGRRDPCGLRDARLRSQRGTGRGLPHDDPSAGGDPPGAPRAGQAPPATAAGADRQGLLLAGQPGLAVLPPHPYPRSRSGPTKAVHRRARGSRGGRPPVFDAAVYKDHDAVERGFSSMRINGSQVVFSSILAVA